MVASSRIGKQLWLCYSPDSYRDVSFVCYAAVKARRLRNMLNCFAQTGTAVNKFRRLISECRPKASAYNTTKNNHPFRLSRTKSFFHLLTFQHSNPLPQVNSFKNRELNAKLIPISFAKDATYTVCSSDGSPANPTYKVCSSDGSPANLIGLAHLNYRMVGNNMVEFDCERHK